MSLNKIINLTKKKKIYNFQQIYFHKLFNIFLDNYSLYFVLGNSITIRKNVNENIFNKLYFKNIYIKNNLFKNFNFFYIFQGPLQLVIHKNNIFFKNFNFELSNNLLFFYNKSVFYTNDNYNILKKMDQFSSKLSFIYFFNTFFFFNIYIYKKIYF